LVIGVILTDFANGDGPAKFLDSNMTYDALVNSMLWKLELTACDLVANIIDYYHETELYLNLTVAIQYFGGVCIARHLMGCVERSPRGPPHMLNGIVSQRCPPPYHSGDLPNVLVGDAKPL